MRGFVAPLVAAAAVVACDSTGDTVPEEVGPDVASDAGDAVVEAGDDAAPDGPSGADPGPLTFIATEMEVVEDRRCDLDGDGEMDNAIADLGSPASTTFLVALNTAIIGELDEESQRFLIHMPWVDDRRSVTDPDLTLISFEGWDLDSPPNRDDDFSGSEPFRPTLASVDECGEPLYIFGEGRLEAGELMAIDGVVPIPTAAPLQEATFTGTIERGGGAAQVSLCGYMQIGDLGEGNGFPNTGDLSTLEVLLAGGSAFGIPGVPGLSPDVDVDGDGLERIELDGDNHVALCIDGDMTEIAGADCWSDPRMADGVSFNMDISAVSAAVARPGPLAPWMLEALCPGGAPEESLWQACARGGESSCGSGEERRCTTSCGTDGVERCLWDCSGFGPCRGEDVLTTRIETCGDVEAHGTASCAGDPPAVLLGDGGESSAAVVLSQPTVVGLGRVGIEATVHSSTANDSYYPGDGWAIVVYKGSSGEILGHAGGDLGVSHDRLGYSLEWRFLDTRPPGWLDDDYISLRALRGDTGFWRMCAIACEVPATPRLDQHAAGSARQAMRLVIEPDDPATEWNEMLVTGVLVSDEEETWLGIGCDGGSCPVQISPGDVVQIGISWACGRAASSVSLDPTEGLTVDVGVVCP